MLEGAYTVVQAGEDVVATSKVRDLEKRIRDLERLLGRKTMENEILTEALDVARPKKTRIALAVLERSQGRFPVSLAAATLHVARSHINERRSTNPKPRGPYRKPDDTEVLKLIRAVTDDRPTFGYRRVTALLNRQTNGRWEPADQRKLVLPIMRFKGLVLERSTARSPGRVHDGVVIALRSNINWCPDHLDIHALNQEVVRVLFVLDACNRQIIAWLTITNAGISGEMVRGLMVAAVKRRFGATKTSHPVEWISDNRSAFTAVSTADTATALDLDKLFRHARSLERTAYRKPSLRP